MRFISRAIRHTTEGGSAFLEPTPEAVQGWVDEAETALEHSLVRHLAFRVAAASRFPPV